MIPQYKTNIGENEIKAVTEVLKSGWIGEGKVTEKFEQEIKYLIRTKNAVSVFNGTLALYIAAKALGIKAEDEVIMPDMTFIASANSILMARGKPVFIDVDKETCNIETNCIEDAITAKTKAIMPVHLYGKPAEMQKIKTIARQNNLYIIEDAAEALGTTCKGQPVGGIGDIGCFSFFANKNITTSEGGMITTNNNELAKKCRIYKDQGREKKGMHIFNHFGINARFTDIQAAIGLGQLSRLKKILRIKKEHQKFYYSLLPDIEFPKDTPGETIWFVNILVKDASRLQKYLFKQGIETRRFFIPLHRQPLYRKKGYFPNADYLYNHGLSLPSYVDLTEEDIKYICKKIRHFYS